MVHISKGVLATAAVAAAAAVLLAAYRLLVIVDRNRVGARAVGRRTSWPLLLARVRPGSLAASTMRESCAPSPVIAAASRACEILGTARRVLADPANRARYDETAGIRLRTRGLSVPVSFPSQPGAERPDVDFIAGIAGLEMLGGLLMLGEWIAPHPRPPSRVAVPDVQGLFYSVCLQITGKLGFRLTTVRLTEHPLPVDGLVVGQSPRPPVRPRRGSVLTVQVWHPPARGTCPGSSSMTQS
jgi:hypothetical protein